ncbi:heparinase II/III family protein [Wenyingzhuangia fucanilytica]|uniref:heparinase II/III family protein n=1 Tax=Wenyingzhuangia fucanilytica TaxID=1790137 RepID=UPI00197EA3C8|nr:heparinase II/III family protein [Wenyingzhuangia fucanilytica]
MNVNKGFDSEIDWNIQEYGKLWVYNLNYFDFLNQANTDIDEGKRLILDFIYQDHKLKDALEPYPISLRGMNWIKFLSKNNIHNKEIDQALYNHYQILTHNLEYHLLGNHLLENGFSLLFGACYFKDEQLYKQAKKILVDELEEQILQDGGHFELSPMYHQIILHRILDGINLMKLNPGRVIEESIKLLFKEKAEKMLSWLSEVTFENGNIPMVNDSAHNIAMSSIDLFKYADSLGLNIGSVNLDDSGYRKKKIGVFELFMDVGDIKPTYQPGHTHSDTFNFELFVYGKPFIVDTGTSTYESNSRRELERGTTAHNTVTIGGVEQTQVWGGFRVAKRAKILSLKESLNEIESTHNGYEALGVLHTRNFLYNENEIVVLDKLTRNTSLIQQAHFHFHPDYKEFTVVENEIIFKNGEIRIKFEEEILDINKETYQYAIGFNKTVTSSKVVVQFSKEIKTIIQK